MEALDPNLFLFYANLTPNLMASRAKTVKIYDYKSEEPNSLGDHNNI